MATSLERSPPGGLGRLALIAVAFGLLAPAPLFALPLAALLVFSRKETRAEVVTAGLAGGLSLWWLLLPGNLPDQVLRTGLLFSTATFVAASHYTRASFTHRALLALGVAVLGIVALFAVFGWSWGELHWWVQYQRGYESRLALAPLRARAGGSEVADALADVLDRSVAFEANNYPALVGLKIMAGLALATAWYHRLTSHPWGVPLGRLRDFRFSEHLGWAAAVPLMIVLLPHLAAAKVAATNLLLLVGALYALRGIGVAAFGTSLAGTGPVATALMLAATLLMLPVVLGGAILLGVLDAGVDLRRRWAKPPVRN